MLGFTFMEYYSVFAYSLSDLVILVQCTYSQAQIAQLNAAVKECEDLIHDYKEQVG